MVKPIDNIKTPEPMRDVRLVNGNKAMAECELAGYERGRQEAAAEYQERLKGMRLELDNTRRNGVTNLIANMEQAVQLQLSRRLKDLESELIEFSTEAAICLVNSVPITTKIIEAAIHDAVANAEQNTEVSVYVNPDDIKMLKTDGSDLLDQSPHERKMKFVIDPKISRGGCVVDTNCGLIDGQRETRIELLKQALNP